MTSYRSLALWGIITDLLIVAAFYPLSTVTFQFERLLPTAQFLSPFICVYLFIACLNYKYGPGLSKTSALLALNLTTFIELLVVSVLWPIGFTIASYLLIPFGNQLIDPYLVAFDEFIGLPVNEVVRFFGHFPRTARFLEFAYGISMHQILFVMAYWGGWHLECPRGRANSRSWEAISLFVWGTTIGLLSLVFLPATAPFDYYGLDHSEGQLGFLQTFSALRTGEPFLIGEGYGMITFPSFHVFMSVAIIWAFRDQKVIRVPIAIFNVLVIMSTVTTGMHYVADVIAGILFFWICVRSGQMLTRN